jgi:hypothetical protein
VLVLVGFLKRAEGKTLEFKRDLSSPDGALKERREALARESTRLLLSSTPARRNSSLVERASGVPASSAGRRRQ